MSLNLRIDSVRLKTDAQDYDFDFRAPCTVLEGPVGTGKSSLLELIKYGLGGNATLTPVIRAEVRGVEVTAVLGDTRVILERSLGAGSDVLNAMDPGDRSLLLTLTIRPKRELMSVSEYLLELAQFPTVRIPRSRSKSSAASVPLSFADVYAYAYVEQQGIDRSIVHHTEVYREPKRRAVFELMFGLSTAEALRLETMLGEVKDELKSYATRRSTIASFLEGAKVEPRIELERRVADCTRAVEEALAGLAALRANIAYMTTAHDSLRDRLRAVEVQREEAQRLMQEAEMEVERRTELVAQLHLEVVREDRMSSASRRLGPLEFVACPRCLQDIEFGRTDGSHCVLCTQSLPRSQTPLTDVMPEEDSQDDAAAYLAEQESMLTYARKALEHRFQNLAVVAQQAADAREALDLVTAEAVSPKFDEIEILSTRRGDAAARSQAAREKLSFWEELEQVEQTIAALTDDKIYTQGMLEEERSRLASRAQVLSDLSDQLNETVRELQVPWANRARFDERNFLPLVNDEEYEGLAVAGGTKTVVTVAYHLTLLAYALPRQECLLPSLLILDTPRKNLGSNTQDAEMGDRIYRRIRALVGVHGPKVQFIIADNDVPSGDDWFSTIHLDYDRPLLPHVLHPGEAAAISGQLERVGVDL